MQIAVHLIHVTAESFFICIGSVPVFINTCVDIFCIKNRINSVNSSEIFIKQCFHKDSCIDRILSDLCIAALIVQCQEFPVSRVVNVERSSLFYISVCVQIICRLQIAVFYK